jgi:hypothetical protein
MNHFICESCETVHHCAANGCIPIEEYDARTPRAFLSLPDILIAAAAVLICAFVGAVVIARWMA